VLWSRKLEGLNLDFEVFYRPCNFFPKIQILLHEFRNELFEKSNDVLSDESLTVTVDTGPNSYYGDA